MILDFPISFRDHYRASRAIQRRQVATWLAYLFFMGVPLVLLVLLLRQGYTIGEALREQWGGLLGGPAFLFVGVPLLQAWNLRSARRSNPSLAGDQVYEFTPDGMLTRGGVHEISLKWEAFTRAVETREFFLLYFSASAAYFIPKHAIARSASMESFRDLLLRNMPGRTKLRGAA